MNKHMRLVVSALFIVIILLAIAITRFYSDTTKSTSGRSAQTDIEKKHGADALGNRIFEDSSGLYGIIDSSDRIIVAPEWLELSFAGSDTCIASSEIGGKKLMGCVDYEGNIVVPVIYQNITRHMFMGFVFYTAQTAADGSWVIYDENLNPCFPCSWADCSLKEHSGTQSQNILTLTSGSGGVYTYLVTDSGFVFTGAEIPGNALNCGFSINIDSRILLSKLDPAMLEEMTSAAASYLDFAYTGNSDHLSDTRTVGENVFTGLFPGDKKIISKKLDGISSVFIYSLKSDDNTQHFAVSISANTILTYSDINGKTATLSDVYKAVVEFSGDSESDLAAVSGSFVLREPVYPQPEPDPEPPPATEPATEPEHVPEPEPQPEPVPIPEPSPEQ